MLTHWGRVTHICVSKLTIIGSDNGLSPSRRQAIIWTNAGILLIQPSGTNFSEILIEIDVFPFKKMHLEMSSAKYRPFCLGLNVLSAPYWVLHCFVSYQWQYQPQFINFLNCWRFSHPAKFHSCRHWTGSDSQSSRKGYQVGSPQRQCLCLNTYWRYVLSLNASITMQLLGVHIWFTIKENIKAPRHWLL